MSADTLSEPSIRGSTNTKFDVVHVNMFMKIFSVPDRMQSVTARDHNKTLQKVIPAIKADCPSEHKTTPFNSFGEEMYVVDGTSEF